MWVYFATTKYWMSHMPWGLSHSLMVLEDVATQKTFATEKEVAVIKRTSLCNHWCTTDMSWTPIDQFQLCQQILKAGNMGPKSQRWPINFTSTFVDTRSRFEDELIHLEMLALTVWDTFDFTLKFLAELSGEGIDNVWVSTKEIY